MESAIRSFDQERFRAMFLKKYDVTLNSVGIDALKPLAQRVCREVERYTQKRLPEWLREDILSDLYVNGASGCNELVTSLDDYERFVVGQVVSAYVAELSTSGSIISAHQTSGDDDDERDLFDIGVGATTIEDELSEQTTIEEKIAECVSCYRHFRDASVLKAAMGLVLYLLGDTEHLTARLDMLLNIWYGDESWGLVGSSTSSMTLWSDIQAELKALGRDTAVLTMCRNVPGVSACLMQLNVCGSCGSKTQCLRNF
jgi:hypothetical protein